MGRGQGPCQGFIHGWGKSAVFFGDQQPPRHRIGVDFAKSTHNRKGNGAESKRSKAKMTAYFRFEEDFANNREYITIMVYKNNGKRVYLPCSLIFWFKIILFNSI